MSNRAPRWFLEAIDTPSRSHTTVHDDCTLHYRSWGERGQPGVLLVHGGAAHSHWWDFVAPALCDRYHVVALDMSGHGESGRRERYPLRTWAAELLAVIDASQLGETPVVVGHSMGGIVTVVARALYGERFAGTVIVDAPVRSVQEQQARSNRIPAFRNPRTHATREAALRSFRLIPQQPCENDYLVRYIAEHSLRETPEGFAWKFDPAIMKRTVYEPMDEHLATAKCPAALIVGSQSDVVPAEMVTSMRDLLGEGAPLVCIEDAHHHVLLDQPERFIREVRRLVDGWQTTL